MPAQKVGLNLSKLADAEQPSFNFQNDSAQFLADVPVKANEITGGWYGFITLAGLFFWLFWKLQQDQLAGGDFGYSNVKSIGIASAVCGIVGLYAVNFGYFVNFYHIVIFIITAFICVGVNWKSSN